ncbi:DNA-binding XRE family transcriptional regulator [Silvibacterium bohemicum]|uniref:DNA-binding XRE family transcriptional regulator n=1 Tax=Silvibacterium bohemicum TaxID=1577686 RepID=A0A841JT43_9BACT|nr:helix-turn-helix transcriptional regulator [Silvibacterium bohemicum]MBB6143667.1 DNA-binding XRE family transcriptional regulator [Silvibacterium bohemicum]
MNSPSQLHRFTPASSFDRWPHASQTRPYAEAKANPGVSADKTLAHRDLVVPAPANDVSSRFGRRLRELRRNSSLTQSGMAKKFGIDRSYISDVERGRKSISLPILEVIALGLRISLSDLFRDI